MTISLRFLLLFFSTYLSHHLRWAFDSIRFSHGPTYLYQSGKSLLPPLGFSILMISVSLSFLYLYYPDISASSSVRHITLWYPSTNRIECCIILLPPSTARINVWLSMGPTYSHRYKATKLMATLISRLTPFYFDRLSPISNQKSRSEPRTTTATSSSPLTYTGLTKPCSRIWPNDKFKFKPSRAAYLLTPMTILILIDIKFQ